MKNKMYLILYYVSFLIMILFLGFSIYKSNGLLTYFESNFSNILSSILSNVLGVINVLLVIIFTILILKKKNFNVQKSIYPIFYLCFLTIIIVMCFLFNNKVMKEYIHFNYYSVFVCIGYLFLNVYSLFLVNYKK